MTVRGLADRTAGAGLGGRRQRYRACLEAGLAAALELLAHRPEVQEVLVIGSQGQGRGNLFSDLDLVVVMDSRLGFLERTAALYTEEAPLLEVDLDLFVYTPAEWERMQVRPFFRSALAAGRRLYAKTGG
ncbi:MAG: nucleotidyltransferase domain-containing protein [Thermodesulfobacteriota bacterium]